MRRSGSASYPGNRIRAGSIALLRIVTAKECLVVYNYIAADATCTRCGSTSYFPEIQFKFGFCRGIKYLVGYTIELNAPDWRKDSDPVIPPGGRFVTEGIGRCPNCNEAIDFNIGILDSVITDVMPVGQT